MNHIERKKGLKDFFFYMSHILHKILEQSCGIEIKMVYRLCLHLLDVHIHAQI